MRHQSFWASFMKPQNVLTTIAWLGLLLLCVFYVYGTYKEAPTEFRVLAKIHLARPLIKAIALWSNLLENLPRADIVQQKTNSSHLKYVHPNLEKKLHTKIYEYERLLDEYKLFLHKLQNRNYTIQFNAPDQHDASFMFFLELVRVAPKGSPERERAQKELDEEISRRSHVDCVMSEIGKVIFNTDEFYESLMAIPVLDDWDCYKTMLYVYKTHCAIHTSYEVSYGRAFANMCNAGIQPPRLSEVASQVCANVGNIIPECEGK